MVVNGARNIVFLFVEEQTVKGVDVKFRGVGVFSIENGVTKREQANGFIEVGTKDRIAIFGFEISHKLTSQALYHVSLR